MIQCAHIRISTGITQMMHGSIGLHLVSGAATFTTCDPNSYDTSMVVYEGSCDNQVACNGDGDEDSACQNWHSEIVDYAVTTGETYYIRLGGWEAASGTGTLTITLVGGDVIGACCTDDGSCMDSTFDQCQNAGGHGAVQIYVQICIVLLLIAIQVSVLTSW